MKFCRIELSRTNYKLLENSLVIKNPNIAELNQIYKDYCFYKKFESVMPIFDSQYTDSNNIIMGYYDKSNLVAFSLIRLYDTENAEALQFAWNYSNPNLRLGILSLENECEFLKRKGYKYLYLGQDADYKRNFEGYEILGTLNV